MAEIDPHSSLDGLIAQPFNAIRLTVSTPLSFEDVQAKLEKAVKAEAFVPGQFGKEFTEAVITKDTTAAEKVIQGHLGPSGFMLFTSFQHGPWFSLYNTKPNSPKITAYVIGNPLVAKDLLQLEYMAALHVPFRIVLLEKRDESGEPAGCTVSWDQPSSKIAIGVLPGEEEERLVKAAKGLDEKIVRLVKGIAEAEGSRQRL